MEVAYHPIIRQALESIKFFSNMKYVFVLKDHMSRHLAMTNYAAYAFGISNLNDVLGKTTMEAFGNRHPKISKQITELDEYLINSNLESISSISFFNYVDGVQARLVIRYKLIDPQNGNFLGILYQEIPSGLNNECVSIMDSICSEEQTMIRFPDNSTNPLVEKLTVYEHEICFLISIGWSLSQIHNFLNRVYPERARTLDAVIKKKNVICNKFRLENTHVSALRELLIKGGVYKKIPPQLLEHLQGAYLIQ